MYRVNRNEISKNIDSVPSSMAVVTSQLLVVQNIGHSPLWIMFPFSNTVSVDIRLTV